jgi:prepilin-type N-terminal cleavage/methylation domain-containing protein
MYPRNIRRPAFTLIEMMVSLALVLFIMAILSEAFVAALESYHTLKGIGDMDEKLRAAGTVLRHDLVRVRFSDATGGGRKLSQVQLPPLEGCFRLWQGSPSIATLEGTDPYGIPSNRATDHFLQFMIDAGADENARRDRKENWFAAAIGPGSPLTDPTNNQKYGWYPQGFWDGTNFYSQQAEVSWFLRPLLTPGGIPMTAEGTQLYTLYRRQLVAVPNNSGVNTGQPPQRVAVGPSTPTYLNGDPTGQEGLTWSYFVGSPPNGGRKYMVPNYTEVSCKADPSNSKYLYFNSPRDLTMPIRRKGMVPLKGQIKPQQQPGQLEMAGMLSNGTYPNGGQQGPYWLSGIYPNYADESQSSAMQSMLATDLILTNVISFDVKLAFDEGPIPLTQGNFVDLWGITDAAQHPQPYNLPFQNQAFGQQVPRSQYGGPRVYDTWSSYFDGYYNYTAWNVPGNGRSPNYTAIPLPLNPKAIQIIIRIWDTNTESSRQITLVQDM